MKPQPHAQTHVVSLILFWHERADADRVRTVAMALASRSDARTGGHPVHLQGVTWEMWQRVNDL